MLAPTYAPILMLSKHYFSFGDGVFELISAAHTALARLLQASPPRFMLLSLADFHTKIGAFRENVANLLQQAKKCGTKVIIDSGALEKPLSEYLSNRSLFDDPVANLKAQLSLQPPPSIVTLLDDLERSCTFEELLRHEDAVIFLLEQARPAGISGLLVLHDGDIQVGALGRLKDSRLINQVDFIAMPDDELENENRTLSKLQMLGKRLVLFGIDEFSVTRISNLVRYGVWMGDIMKWSSNTLTLDERRLVRAEAIDLDALIKCDPFHFSKLCSDLYDNLLVLQKIEFLGASS